MRRWEAQSADGIIERIPQLGILKIWSSTTTPTNTANPAGYAAGCLWFFVPTNGPPKVYQNIGGNGEYIGGTQNTVANWLEVDPTSLGMGQFGLRTASQFFATGGTAYRTILNNAGISPSAAGADKIVDVWTLPANVFDQKGRIIEFSMFATVNTGSALNAEMKLIAAPTNVITWPSNPLPNAGTNNANIASQTDGSVTVTGGTTLFDTGAISFNTSSADSPLILRGMLACLSTSAQESMTTEILAGAVSAGAGVWTDRTLTTTGAVVFVVTANMQTTAADFKYNGMTVRVYN